MPVSFQPLMREVLENKVELSKDEARALIDRCLKVLYYRDARSYNRVRTVPDHHLINIKETFEPVELNLFLKETLYYTVSHYF